MTITSSFLTALECTKFVFGRDSASRTPLGELTALPRLPSWALLLRGKGEGKRRKKGQGGEGRQGEETGEKGGS